MKLTRETEGLALVLDTAPLKARRWSRIESFPPTHIPHLRATRAYTLAL
jgi:hypothetical protein